MVGIRSFGGYVPRNRLDRAKIFQAVGWVNAANAGHARGEKSVANYDEDSITMSVAAAVDSLNGMDRSGLGGVYFASTTLPYKERQNAGIIAGALAMGDNVRSADFTGSLKSGTTAIVAACEAVAAKGANNVVVCSSDCRLGKPGSPQEMLLGDAAAAFVISDQDVIAEYKGAFTLSYDFVDHFRGSKAQYDRGWEDRWIRDLGFDKFIPNAINGLLDKYGLKIEDFAKVVYPCYYAAERKKLDKVLGLPPEKIQDPMMGEIGEMGTAQPLVMLARALEDAKPGDKILVVSFGSGCDALYFEVTDGINRMQKPVGISGHLSAKHPLDNFEKYLAWRGILDVDMGLRSEMDRWSQWSMIWRNRKAVLGLIGTKCTACGTPQYPPQRICVNPDCRVAGQMEDYCFSDKTGKVMSFTGDNLAASINPPLIYGQIGFDGGGKYMFEFTGCDLEQVKVGMPVAFSFRIKYYDQMRDVTAYYWKAMPA
jgi:3-hydroxy-3-methylglutaryl CoA synthase